MGTQYDKIKQKAGRLPRYLIGIDTGVNTGFCVWDRAEKRINFLGTVKIHEAMAHVRELTETEIHEDIAVYFEDARLRKWYGNSGREKLQGAGSVKRDAVIWEDYLKDMGLEYHAIAPKNNTTKMTAEFFRTLTGYHGKTNEHARDAAMLVFNR